MFEEKVHYVVRVRRIGSGVEYLNLSCGINGAYHLSWSDDYRRGTRMHQEVAILWAEKLLVTDGTEFIYKIFNAWELAAIKP